MHLITFHCVYHMALSCMILKIAQSTFQKQIRNRTVEAVCLGLHNEPQSYYSHDDSDYDCDNYFKQSYNTIAHGRHLNLISFSFNVQSETQVFSFKSTWALRQEKDGASAYHGKVEAPTHRSLVWHLKQVSTTPCHPHWGNNTGWGDPSVLVDNPQNQRKCLDKITSVGCTLKAPPS